MTLYEIDFSKKIRLSTWNLIYFILYSHANNRFHDTDNKEFSISPDLVKRQDWEYYQEIDQKKKVKKWLWIFKTTINDGISNTYLSYNYFSSEEQVIEFFKEYDCVNKRLLIGPALWSEIEVEE